MVGTTCPDKSEIKDFRLFNSILWLSWITLLLRKLNLREYLRSTVKNGSAHHLLILFLSFVTAAHQDLILLQCTAYLCKCILPLSSAADHWSLQFCCSSVSHAFSTSFAINQPYAVVCAETHIYTRLCFRKPAYPKPSSKISTRSNSLWGKDNVQLFLRYLTASMDYR